MSKTLSKIVDLEYSELVTLAVIEDDADLKLIFAEDVQLPFSVLYHVAKENKLNAKTKEVLESLFNNIIVRKKSLVEQYLRFSKKHGVEIKPIDEVKGVVEDEEPVIEEIVEPVQEIIKEVFKGIKPVKVKTEKELPRRYGKEKILKDIEVQGGKATPLQNAMLKVNDLKNIYVTLSARGIKDMIGGSNLLTDTDCRDIVSVVGIAQRKLENILKRK